MPAPRKISTSNRADVVKKLQMRLATMQKTVAAIIVDLSKPHVDDKAKAKVILTQAKKLEKGLSSAAAA